MSYKKAVLIAILREALPKQPLTFKQKIAQLRRHNPNKRKKQQ